MAQPLTWGHTPIPEMDFGLITQESPAFRHRECQHDDKRECRTISVKLFTKFGDVLHKLRMERLMVSVVRVVGHISQKYPLPVPAFPRSFFGRGRRRSRLVDLGLTLQGRHRRLWLRFLSSLLTLACGQH